MKIAKAGAIILILLFLSILQNVVSGKRIRRIRLFLMPFLAIIYSISALVLLTKYNTYLQYIFLTRIEPYSQELKNSQIVLVNLLIIVLFILIKIIVRPIISHVWKKKELLSFASSVFYKYDEDYNEWFLLNQWRDFRTFFYIISIAVNVASGVYLGLTWVLEIQGIKWVFVYPCAALIVVNEIYNYINGQTKEEFEHRVESDLSTSRRIRNYYKLREIYETILPEPILTAHTGAEFSASQTAADVLKQLKTSEDSLDNVIDGYFEGDGRFKRVHPDGVQATRMLMHHQNVVFLNPFYRDEGIYITLPMVYNLLAGKKSLILCGRKTSQADVEEWLRELLYDYSRMSTLWRVEQLSDREPKCEVGILSFTQLYNKNVVNANLGFLHQTGFVLLIEPSVMLNTGQIALSILAQEMGGHETPPVYCVCDRHVNGLVDTLSHVLHAELTNVVATPVPRCNYTAITWDACGDYDRQRLFDKQTKFLGNGFELAAIAIKNQIPKVTWYSETKAPVRDIKWIAGQFYPTICRYMNIPNQQNSLYEKIEFVSNLWCLPAAEERFVIAEDEFCNMFNSLRAYLSRGVSHAFVNILSEDYILRDYMRCNRQLFTSDPNAIPSLVPDYAKTERNTVLKLILTMAYRPVSEQEVLEELHLVGIESKDAFASLSALLHKYTCADDSVFTVQGVKAGMNIASSLTSCVFSIREEDFERFFSSTLKSAFFIVEHEETEEEYIDAKMFSHVTQTVLPGQFMTYDGKYYLVKHVSPQSGVVLRRAADLYDGRKYYRQIRNYHLEQTSQATVLSEKTVMDINTTLLSVDFSVTTDGYIELDEYHDLRSGRVVSLAKDPKVSDFTREYHNKTIMRVRFPDTDNKLCFTICLLLNEVFRTTFPNSYPYLSVVAKMPNDIEGMLRYAVHAVDGDVQEGDIYIIEDSDIDLGLLEAVERNFNKILEIVTDFLDWHIEKMREPENKDPIPMKKEASAYEKQERKRRNFVTRLLNRIRLLFGGKKEEEVKIDNPVDAKPDDTKSEGIKESEAEEQTKVPESDSESGSYTLDGEESQEKEDSTFIPEETEQDQVTYSLDHDENGQGGSGLTPGVPETEKDQQVEVAGSDLEDNPEDYLEDITESDPDIIDIDGTDIFDNDGMPEDQAFFEDLFTAMGLVPLVPTRYQKKCYLKYGFEEIDRRICADELYRYLRARGFSDNDLTKARKRDLLVENYVKLSTVNRCDFCGIPLNGVSYEKLNDGRVRCNDCSANAITLQEDFRDLFYRCLELMEEYYSIRINVPIIVKMTDARTIAKGVGSVFRPSNDVAVRALGYAQRKNGKYNLLIENGSPRLASIDTMVHELTHIWQFTNWNSRTVDSHYSMNSRRCTRTAEDIVYEGMAVWASIQFLYQIGENYYATQMEAMQAARQDVYGMGFRLYRETYPFVKDASMLHYTPFAEFPPIDPGEVKALIRSNCTNKKCNC